jgi:hypothetical protein
MLPYAKGPVVAKARRGDPTAAEMSLLAQANTTGAVVLKHPRGHDVPPILTLAFEMSEGTRRWFSPPGAPEIRDNTRYFTFHITEAGTLAYKRRMADFGLER